MHLNYTTHVWQHMGGAAAHMTYLLGHDGGNGQKPSGLGRYGESGPGALI